MWGNVSICGVNLMLGGVTHLNLDPKNRLAIPAKYRDILQSLSGGKIVITLESAQCLLIYPENEWGVVRDKVQNLPNSLHPLVKSYQRLVLGYAENLEIDKSGRVLLPAILKQMAKLDKEIVLVGMGNKFELWDKNSWHQETEKALQSSAEDLAQLLNGFNL
ncbi:division/cell wall cluster transcriptional repressor MraZ [Aquella oligotrophica]|nr:division/cell wall cluster transcriptional repressor MraZ [Aquella oligotrophica]